jgi:pimeloyl-ACP methyl ester carboxylesterase
MDLLYDPVPGPGTDRILLIMLPGANDKPEAFVRHGFVQAVRQREPAVDTVAADAHLDYYLERTVIQRIDEDVVAPARARGYKRIWLVGVSVGGMGSLLYARAHPGVIEGVILLAPYLGSTGAIAELARSGGFASWQPASAAAVDDESALLVWLKAYQPGSVDRPRIFLGYGRSDRFALAGELLAARLPAQQVSVSDGGHDWQTWTRLWSRILDQNPFAGTATN